MIDANDIHSRCPVSEKSSYLVFEWKQPIFGAGFWATTALISDREEALGWANAQVNDRGDRAECFVCAVTRDEGENIRRNHLTFTDEEVAIYRAPYSLPLAAE